MAEGRPRQGIRYVVFTFVTSPALEVTCTYIHTDGLRPQTLKGNQDGSRALVLKVRACQATQVSRLGERVNPRHAAIAGASRPCQSWRS
jgi:hypothetical protein